jgi:hypothetical protein
MHDEDVVTGQNRMVITYFSRSISKRLRPMVNAFPTATHASYISTSSESQALLRLQEIQNKRSLSEYRGNSGEDHFVIGDAFGDQSNSERLRHLAFLQ